MMSLFISLIWIVLKVLLIALPLLGAVAYMTLAERKILAYAHVRLGPNRVGFLGLLQPLADGVKLFFKEIIIPSKANPIIFILAPIVSFATAAAAWAVIPFKGVGIGQCECEFIVCIGTDLFRGLWYFNGGLGF